MITPNSNDAPGGAKPLEEFIEGVCASDPFKVEEDLGQGYVKLRSTEAEKRQAAQDIKCVEDIVIELLRNSRDAGAEHIFLATAKEGDLRTLVIIDDGTGVPSEMWEAIFQPRVTSKLETAHMDKWGMHGRGMALYSTRVNARTAEVVASRPGAGCALRVVSDGSLAEKADQSTFPRFEEASGVMAMRGPKNILRTSCEFALEHRDQLKVHLGTPAQIACSLYRYGLATVPAYARAFGDGADVPLARSLGLANGPEDLLRLAKDVGLDISLRTARRIIDGASESVDDLTALMARRSFQAPTGSRARRSARGHGEAPALRLAEGDKERFLQKVMVSFQELAEAHYLEPCVTPKLRVEKDRLLIDIPLAQPPD